MNQTVRIIGGKFRGKKLHFPISSGLRPTPDRVRETLFNWLMQDIYGAKCLDAFAGSGALGFEAISRGAAEVVMVETAPSVLQHLRKHAAALAVNNLQIIADDARHYLRTSKQAFDIIFMDPPFAENYLADCIALMTTNTILRKEGLLYIESAEKPSLAEEHWILLKEKKAGQVFYALYQKR